MSLTELNLRRNSIERIFDLDSIPSLQRIFLSHNLIKYMTDIKCIFSLRGLIELSLDGNPISTASNQQKYRFAIVTEMPGLKHLDLQKVTDEERRPPTTGTPTSAAQTEHGEDTELMRTSPLLNQVSGQQQQLLHLSKFLGTVGNSGGGSLPPSGPGSRIGTANGSRLVAGSVTEGGLNLKQGFSTGSSDWASDKIVNSARRESKESANEGSNKHLNTADKASVDQSNLGTIGLLKMSSSGLAAASPTNLSANSSKTSPKPQEKTFRMNSLEIFDIPGDGNSKAMQVTGGEWEWNHTRRTLSLISCATLDRIKCPALFPKFANQISSMPMLKKLVLIENDIKSLNDIVALGSIFRGTEHLVMSKQPIEQLSSKYLKGAIITAFPNLKSYNQMPVSEEERELSMNIYGRVLNIDGGPNRSYSSSLMTAFEASLPSARDSSNYSPINAPSDIVHSSTGAGGIAVTNPSVSGLVGDGQGSNEGAAISSVSSQKVAMPPQSVAGYNVASLGGIFSCVFSTVASTAASRANAEAMQSALCSRELDRKGFDQVLYFPVL